MVVARSVAPLLSGGALIAHVERAVALMPGNSFTPQDADGKTKAAEEEAFRQQFVRSVHRAVEQARASASLWKRHRRRDLPQVTPSRKPFPQAATLTRLSETHRLCGGTIRVRVDVRKCAIRTRGAAHGPYPDFPGLGSARGSSRQAPLPAQTRRPALQTPPAGP